jgi:hypothetical protein
MVKSKKHIKHIKKTKSKTIKHKRNNKHSKRVIHKKSKVRGHINKKKLKKGGVLLNDVFPDRPSALLYFIRNSKFKILTNSSLTCITLLATLNPGNDTPFYSARSNNFKTPVNKILLKISITNNAGEAPALLPIPGREYNGIQLMTVNEMVQEVNLQKRIYRKTFVERAYNSPFDGICPAIIETSMHVGKPGTMRLGNFFISNLEPRNGRTLDNDRAELISILNYADQRFPNNNISMIAMEFMDGYSTYYDAWTEGRIIPAHFHMVNYVFKQLHDLGYMHNDAHIKNMMINTNVPYFTTTGRPDVLGRVIIIDFGRTTPLTDAQRALSDNDRLELETFYHDDSWAMYKYDQRINDMLTLGRQRVVDGIFTPIIAEYMRLGGLPLPHDPYTLLNNVIIPRNLIDRYFLLGGLKLDVSTPNSMKIPLSLKTKATKKLELKDNYDEGYDLDTSYYNEVKNQLKSMNLDELKAIVFSQLDLSDE